MKLLSAADISNDEVLFAADFVIDELVNFCWYCYGWSSYLLLIRLLIKYMTKVDIGIENAMLTLLVK